MKTFRIKQDVQIYHPHKVILKAGTVLYADQEPILVKSPMILTKREDIDQYIEEVKET